jgi:membrane-bound lytic murein transglycosylase D
VTQFKFFGLKGALTIVLLSMSMSACASRSKSAMKGSPSNSTNPILFEEEYEAQRQGELPEYDIPVVQNAKVETWLNYFQGRGAKWFRIWMERSGRYIPFMRQILREHGLPEDLVYLAMIESGFSSRAYSRARAVGHWQFMRATGKRYGLRVNFWIDERRDPEKATVAAARHLKDLYDQFQDWKLAAAAYNAGAGRISRAMRRYRTEDFWEIAKHRHLALETRNYVPKLIAAAMIAKDPARYGFEDIELQEPLQFDKIVVRRPVNLRKLADKTNVEFEDLWYLNPELNHAVTPPNSETYELRVPARRAEQFLAAVESLGPEDAIQYASHQVRRGESIGKIARRYGVSSSEIASLNNLPNPKALKVGQSLLLPIPLGAEPPQRAYSQRVARKGSSSSLAETESYVVQRGDSLWSISRETGLSVRTLRDFNELDGNSLRIGQRIRIPGGADLKKSRASRPQASIASSQSRAARSSVVHIVRRGETLSGIAARYGVSVRDIKTENGLSRSHIAPGRRLQIPRS